MTTPADSPTSPANDPKDGQPSYKGWEYQILASVWLTLEFVLLKGSTSVVIEPVSEDDLAASYEVQNEVPTLIKTENFQIQIKLRNNVLWTVATFEDMFPEKVKKKRGPSPRDSPLKYLEEDMSSRYILVTNTFLDRGLNDFKISQIGEDSRASALTKVKVDPDVARRIGILDGKSTELLTLKIAALLKDVGRVPGQRMLDCIESLRANVRRRLGGEESKIFPRADVEKIICHHGGSFVARRPPVFPSNFTEIKDRLSKQSALILIGPPGTGKTELALALADDLKFGDPPANLEVVNSPEKILAARTSLDDHHSTVYFVEDPWGQGPPDANADYMTAELPKLLRRAGPGKTFIVTSTISAFREATESDREATESEPPQFKKWIQHLNPEDYSSAAREELYERRIAEWGADKKMRAQGLRSVVMKELETPFSIVIFLNQLDEALADGKVSESEATKIAKESNVGAIADKLTARIRRGDDNYIRSAIVIWALLTIGGNLVHVDGVRAARVHMQHGGMQTLPDVEYLFNYLTTSWLQARTRGYLATPTVKKALARFSKLRPGLFDETMAALIRGWSAVDDFKSIHLCVREASSAAFVPLDVSWNFDVYLARLAIVADGYSFRYVFDELARFATSDNPAAEFARVLTARIGTPRHFWRPSSGPKWKSRTLTASEITSMTESEECCGCAAKFVADYLSHGGGHWGYSDTYEPREIVDFLGQFGWPIEEWFLKSFYDTLRDPSESTPYMLRCLLLLCPERIDTIIADCAEAVRASDKPRSAADRESERAEQQGEKNCDYHSEDDSYWDNYNRASEALQIAVEHKRLAVGFHWILDHPDVEQILPSWVSSATTRAGGEEHTEIVKCCESHSRSELAARIVAIGNEPAFHEWVIKELKGHDVEVPKYLKPILLRFSRDEEFLQEVETYSDEPGQLLALLGLLIIETNSPDLDDAPVELQSVNWFHGYGSVESRFSNTEQNSLVACYLAEQQFSVRSTGECDENFLLSLTREWPEANGVLSLEVLSSSDFDTEPELDRFLKSTNAGVRRRAWRICSSREQLVNIGLLDCDCHCRIEAMKRLVLDPSPEEWKRLLDLGTDRSAFVRRQLARMIGESGFEDGIPVLISLLIDERDFGYHQDENDCDIFEVARTAASMLLKLSPSMDSYLNQIRDFLEKCEGSSVDTNVHEQLFRLLAGHPSPETMSFCCRYLNSIWIESEWKGRGGHCILDRCVEVVCTMLDHAPDLISSFDLSIIAETAKWPDEDGWLVAPVTAAIGLGAKSETVDIPAIIASKNFNQLRARLLVSLSPALYSNAGHPVRDHLSNADEFLKFLQWTSEGGIKDYAVFKTSHPEFDGWLEPLAEGSALERHLYWAVWRLIAITTGQSNPVEFPWRK